jgi:cytochrome c-type biogenesis protein CcmF
VQDNPRMGKAPEPDTRHYLDRDVYSHVTYADLSMQTEETKPGAYSTAKNFAGHIGDTIPASNSLLVIDSLRTDRSREQYEKNDSTLLVTAVIRCLDAKGKTIMAYPKFIIRNNMVIPENCEVPELGLRLLFWKINPEEETVEISVSEKLSNAKDFIVMKAYIFPYINILWLGCVMMGIGTVIAIVERVKKNRRAANEQA